MLHWLHARILLSQVVYVTANIQIPFYLRYFNFVSKGLIGSIQVFKKNRFWEWLLYSIWKNVPLNEHPNPTLIYSIDAWFILKAIAEQLSLILPGHDTWRLWKCLPACWMKLWRAKSILNLLEIDYIRSH